MIDAREVWSQLDEFRSGDSVEFVKPQFETLRVERYARVLLRATADSLPDLRASGLSLYLSQKRSRSENVSTQALSHASILIGTHIRPG